MSPVAKSPAEAKAQVEAKERKDAETKKKNEKHYNDLVIDFGAPGTDGGRFQIAFDNYGNLILQELTINKKTGEVVATQEKFFWVADDGISYTTLNASQAIKKLKEGFKGNQEGLRKLLYDKKFISKTEYQTQDEAALNKGLLQAARNYSVNQIQNFTVEGKTKFTAFNKWITGLKTVGDTDGPDLPVRDINLQDRDVIKALVEDVYMNEIGNAPDDAWLNEKTDYYMNQIKKGTLTTVKKVGGEVVRESTPGFTEGRLRAELQAKLPTERKTEYEQAQSLNFLSFLSQMERG